MIKEMINAIGFAYLYASRARGRVSTSDLQAIGQVSHIYADNADKVLLDGAKATPDEAKDMEEAQLMTTHVDEIIEMLIRQEVC